MKRVSCILLMLSFALASFAADKKKPAVEPKWENTRNYKILKPKNYDPKKRYPFILSLHGFTSNGAGQAGFFPLKDLADKHGFLYCFPSGLDRSWNATNACCDFRNKHNDSAYLRGLILWAQKEYSIDRKKVYVTGLSNGGFMSYRMAQDHADLVTAIAPLCRGGFQELAKEARKPRECSTYSRHQGQHHQVGWRKNHWPGLSLSKGEL